MELYDYIRIKHSLNSYADEWQFFLCKLFFLYLTYSLIFFYLDSLISLSFFPSGKTSSSYSTNFNCSFFYTRTKVHIRDGDQQCRAVVVLKTANLFWLRHLLLPHFFVQFTWCNLIKKCCSFLENMDRKKRGSLWKEITT